MIGDSSRILHRPWAAPLLVAGLVLPLVLLERTPRRIPQQPLAGPVRLGRVRMLGVGDLMAHHDVKRAASEAGGFAALWSAFRPLLAEADLALVNLETPIAPGTGKPGMPYLFNAPGELAAALRESGFQVALTANNHAMDQGSRGILETLQHLAAHGLQAVGTGRDPEEAHAPRILDRGGLRLALLAFTDVHYPGFRGGPGRPTVAVLEPLDVAQRIRELRASVDAIVVSVHWGNENQTVPTPRQREAARILAEAGADVILGHHPHVLQPVEWVEAKGRRCLVAYSLGNFLSNQDRHYRGGDPVASGDERDGAALSWEFTKLRQPDGRVATEVQNPSVQPLWTRNNWREWSSGKQVRREIIVIPNPDGAPESAGMELSEVLALRHLRARKILGSQVRIE